MSGADDEARGLSSESGAIMVMAAGWMGVLVLMAVFVIDIGNWFEHKKHLQLQADAGALAAAGSFAILDPDGCDDAGIEATAKEYAGIAGPNIYNAQIGGTAPEEVHFELNSRTYFGQEEPVDETVVEAPPCAAKMVDVKLTETNLPWYFQASGIVPFINAHARVSILQQDVAQGALPVGVPDPRPKRARVEFVDETTGEVIAGSDLTQGSPANGLAIWSTAADIPVEIDSSRVGLRVALSGTVNNIDCGQPLVECYDAGSAAGILHLRGWSGAGSAPAARDVRMVAGTCSDGYFSYATQSCTVGVRAALDLPFPPADLDVRAVISNSNRAAMSYDSASGIWTSPTTLTIAPGAGPVPVSITWSKKGACDTAPCSGTFSQAQRVFSGTDSRSGPIRLAQVLEAGVSGANSFERCSATQANCTYSLSVTIGVQGSLENARDVSDPVVALRVVGGSQNQSLDCDPAIADFRDEIAQGCGPAYEENTGTACPDPDEPFNCVPLQTGTARNKVAAGMNLRVYGDEKATTCTSPNNWALFPEIPLDDPRIVQVFLTPFGSFEGSGNATIPVTGFATFYATGWSGQGGGFSNPCEGQGDDPVPNGEGGYLVGHFIKYVQTLNNGGGGSEPCDFDAFGSCVAVLTE